MALSSGAPVSPIDTLKEAEFRLTVIVVHAGDKVHDSFGGRSRLSNFLAGTEKFRQIHFTMSGLNNKIHAL